MTSRQSPTMGTSAARFLEISAGSMSACTTAACGANVDNFPVTRSSKRAPNATIRSDRCSAVTAATLPCMPGIPRLRRSLSGNAPRAVSVVTTGIPVSSTSRCSSAQCAGSDHSATDVEHRATGVDDQSGGLLDLLGMRTGRRPIAGQVDLGRPGELRRGLQGVFGNVDENWPGPAGSGDVEGLGNRSRDLVWIGHQVVVLGDRHGDPADVGFLEGVGADGRAGDLPGDRDDRDGVHVRIGDRCHEVGGAGTAGRHAHADPSGRQGITLGRVAGALLVAHQDMPDPSRIQQRVVCRQDCAARNAEHGVDARFLERTDQARGSGHRR